MNFPGDNQLTLTHDAVKEIIRNHLFSLLGDKVRITEVEASSYYSRSGLKVSFTTDEERPRISIDETLPQPATEEAPL